jgi:putative lysine transport system permease protein
MSEPTTFLSWVIFLFQKYHGFFLDGCLITLVLALIGTLFGCAIGLLVGVIRTIPQPKSDANFLVKGLYRLLQFIMLAYVEVFRGTPMIVQAMVIYYGSMQVFHINMSPMFAGFFVVSINTGAYMAETVRGGIESIDAGQTEAAKALGMTHWQTMVSVIIPQTIRDIMPQIGNNLIINIKDTSVLSVISVTELFFSGNSAAGIYYRYFEVYFVVSVLYFAMTFTCACLLRFIERKLDGTGFYQLADPLEDPTGIFPAKKKEKEGGMRIWFR